MSNDSDTGYVVFKYNNAEQKRLIAELLDKGLELVKKTREFESGESDSNDGTRWSEWSDGDGGSLNQYDGSVDENQISLPKPGESRKGAPK